MQHEKVKSAARIIEILEFFADRRKPARMSELTVALGYPASSITALLRTLVTMGYMDFDPATHHYFPAARLSKLTSWMDSGGYEQTTVLEAMHRLRKEVGEPVVLGVRDGLHIEYIVSLHGSERTSTHIKAGSRRLMVQSGIGWLMLSRLPPDEALRIYSRTIAAGLLTPDEFTETAFAATVEDLRGSDISLLNAKDVRKSTVHWNATMISTLIPTPEGHRRLGVGVHGLTHRISEKADVIKRTLRNLTRELQKQTSASLSFGAPCAEGNVVGMRASS